MQFIILILNISQNVVIICINDTKNIVKMIKEFVRGSVYGNFIIDINKMNCNIIYEWVLKILSKTQWIVIAIDSSSKKYK